MPVQECVVCDKLSTIACVECKTSRYCSTTCLSKDRPIHRLFCSQFATFVATTPRPASKAICRDTALDGEEGIIYRRGLLFPVDSKDPQYVWVRCKQTFHTSDGRISEEADLGEFLGSRLDKIETKTNRGVEMDHTVAVWYRDEYLVDGSKPNKCIAALSSVYKRDWRGPVVAMSNVGDENHSEDRLGYYQDIDPEDGRVAQLIFVTCGPSLDQNLADQFERMMPTSKSPETVKGVMISCNGDQHFLKKCKVRSHPFTSLPFRAFELDDVTFTNIASVVRGNAGIQG